jgi:hypothetical protein
MVKVGVTQTRIFDFDFVTEIDEGSASDNSNERVTVWHQHGRY